MQIHVEEIGESQFKVTVSDSGSSTTHQVTVPEELYGRLTGGSVSRAKCVEAAFRFLLDREPKEAILSSFDLPLISHYFPEFEQEFARYLGK